MKLTGSCFIHTDLESAKSLKNCTACSFQMEHILKIWFWKRWFVCHTDLEGNEYANASKTTLLAHFNLTKLWKIDFNTDEISWILSFSHWSGICWRPQKLHFLFIHNETYLENLNLKTMISLSHCSWRKWICQLASSHTDPVSAKCLENCTACSFKLEKFCQIEFDADEIDWMIYLSHWSWRKWIGKINQKLLHLLIQTGPNFRNWWWWN